MYTDQTVLLKCRVTEVFCSFINLPFLFSNSGNLVFLYGVVTGLKLADMAQLFEFVKMVDVFVLISVH